MQNKTGIFCDFFPLLFLFSEIGFVMPVLQKAVHADSIEASCY